MRVTIDRNEAGVPSFYKLEGHPLPLRVINQEPPHDWQATVSEELMESFPLADTPLFRVVLFHSTMFSTLVFTAHHAVADGMSVAYVLHDVLKSIGGERLCNLALPPAQEAIAAAWGSDADSGERRDNPSPPGRMLNRANGRPRVSALRLSRELSEKVRTTARNHKTTVHGALLAAIIVAGRRLSPAWSAAPVKAISPVNLRPTLGVGPDCVVSIVFPSGAYEPEVGSGIWNLATSIRHDLSNTKSREAITAALSVFQHIASSSPTVRDIAEIELHACACDMMLSNLGEAPIAASYGPLRVEALWGPSVFVGIEGEQMIGAATVNGCIHLLHTSFTPIPELLEAAACY